MASILFEVVQQGKIGYTDICLKRPAINLTALKKFRVTKMYLVTLNSNIYTEINTYDKSLNTSTKRISLYSSELACYVDSTKVNMKMDFDDAYDRSDIITNATFLERAKNMKSDGIVSIRFGPDKDAEVKHHAPASSVFNVTREYKGWYFTTSPSAGWIQIIDLNGKLSPEKNTDVYKSRSSSVGVTTPRETTIVNSNPPITLLNPVTEPTQAFTGRYESNRRVTNSTPASNILLNNNSANYNLREMVDSPNSSGTQVSKLIKAAGIYNREDIEWYEKFNRFGCIDPYNNVTTTKEYLFFTKPDLHLFDKDMTSLNPELKDVPIFVDAHNRYYPVLKELQWSADTSNPFMNVLSNSVQSTLDLPGITAEDITTAQNIYGTTLSYRRGSYQSDEAHEFSLEFEDTKYLEIYMLFKLFDEYERRKTWGDITPPDGNYRYRKIIHDQFSIYKFIVGEDGMQLLYWAKLTGVYPKSVPRDAFSDMSSSGGLRFPIQFKAQFVEDMDPRILTDFNSLILPYYGNEDLPLYDDINGSPESDWAQCPYIVSNMKQGSRRINTGFDYYLLWKKA